jgi:hypothetical protein
MEVEAGAKVDATSDLTRVMISYRRLQPGVAEGPADFWKGLRAVVSSAPSPSHFCCRSSARRSHQTKHLCGVEES